MEIDYRPGSTGLLTVPIVDRSTPNKTEWAYPNEGITVHHAASTSRSGCDAFESASRQASAHYYCCDNQIQWWVSEKDGAWHGGASFPNMETIGIETMNSTGAPDWKIADKTFDNLARLMADIAIRHGWGRLEVGKNVWGHRDFSSTACPGPYLYPRLGQLCAKANQYIASKQGGYEDMATAEELKKLPWLYKNANVNGTKDAYKLLTDASNDSKSNGDKLDKVLAKLESIERRVSALER